MSAVLGHFPVIAMSHRAFGSADGTTPPRSNSFAPHCGARRRFNRVIPPHRRAGPPQALGELPRAAGASLPGDGQITAKTQTPNVRIFPAFEIGRRDRERYSLARSGRAAQYRSRAAWGRTSKARRRCGIVDRRGRWRRRCALGMGGIS